MHESQAALEAVQKSAAEAEAAQAAAEALRPWPSDACLVPADYPLYPPSTPQRLHPDIATLGSYMFSLSSPSLTQGQSSLPADSNTGPDIDQEQPAIAQTMGLHAGAAESSAGHAERDPSTTEQGSPHDDQWDDARDALLDCAPDDNTGMMEEEGLDSSPKQADAVGETQAGNIDAVNGRNVTGWQQRLQTGWNEEQLQQVCASL